MWGLASFARLTVIRACDQSIVSITREPVGGVTRFDVVTGDLLGLRASGRDYSTAGISCAAEVAGTSTAFTDTPAAGEALFVLVRPVSGTGDGTYDSLGHGQVGARDAEVGASGGDCP